MNASSESARQGRRHCLFCPSPANSIEHVWPAWVLRRLRRPNISGVEGEQAGRRVRWSGIDPAVRARCVCRDCNHGWLSALETTAQPIIGALIQDIAVSLDREQQAIAAAWAAKMSMMIEATRGASSGLFYSQHQREAFRSHGALPLGSTVWLGRYVGGKYAFLDCADGSHASGDGARPASAYVSTFVAGRLAFQVLSIRLGPEHSGFRGPSIPQSARPWDEATVQIWPTERVAVGWPPRRSFSDRAEPSLETLTRRWTADC